MDKNRVAYLLSFLAILVDRAGGELVIEGLSTYSKTDLTLTMNIDRNNDRVRLVVKKEALKDL